MRLLPNHMLVSVSVAEWTEVLAALKSAGYQYVYSEKGQHVKTVWTKDGSKCLSDYERSKFGGVIVRYFLDPQCLADLTMVSNGAEVLAQYRNSIV